MYTAFKRRDWIFQALEIYRDGVDDFQRAFRFANSHYHFPRVVERPVGKTEEVRGIDISQFFMSIKYRESATLLTARVMPVSAAYQIACSTSPAEPLLFLQKYFSMLTFDEENRSRNSKYRDLFSRAATPNTVLRLTKNPLVEATSLGPSLLTSAGDTLWPTPHSKLFDFAASAKGAEWIDDVAERARERMRPVGNRVIGHCDWRVEHVRFLVDTPVVAFDWDSLCCEREPALIGVVANGFCADWSHTASIAT